MSYTSTLRIQKLFSRYNYWNYFFWIIDKRVSIWNNRTLHKNKHRNVFALEITQLSWFTYNSEIISFIEIILWNLLNEHMIYFRIIVHTSYHFRYLFEVNILCEKYHFVELSKYFCEIPMTNHSYGNIKCSLTWLKKYNEPGINSHIILSHWEGTKRPLSPDTSNGKLTPINFHIKWAQYPIRDMQVSGYTIASFWRVLLAFVKILQSWLELKYMNNVYQPN